VRETQPMQLAEPEAGPSVAAVGKESLERLAIDLLDLSDGLDMPGRSFEPGQPSRALSPMADEGEAGLVLRLDDMLADGNDEIVLLADSGQGQLALATDAEVVATGTAGDHVTADGQDVSGFAFVTFATGMTLFYPDDVELAVCPVG
jgi:hypothetical protein